jgi:glycosyltransferase involved in cell wall biosynthesis
MSLARVYLLLLTGELADANAFIAKHFPGRECVVLSKRELRQGGFRGQVQALRSIKGEAFVFFLRSLSDLQEPQLTVWSSLLHGCRFTVVADCSGRIRSYSRWGRLRLLPRTIASALNDLLVFASSWLLLRAFRIRSHPLSSQPRKDVDLDLAYLYPYPLDTALAGGALSHVKGFLSGVASCGGSCEIFSGRPLPVQPHPVHVIPAKRRFFLFRESLILSYNLRFALAVRKSLRGRAVGALYQRHGRFMVAGGLLSKWLGVPFILEYNGSEAWVAQYWDPTRFRGWLQLCEQISIDRANLIVVVSEALRQELLHWGVPEQRILVNPNAVDPAVFLPGKGGDEVRRQLGLAETDIVVAFVGTFDRWHGTQILEQAIQVLLRGHEQDPIVSRLRFLLIGEGPLSEETRRALNQYAGDQVIFTGLVPHPQVPGYLDAADILVSPHVPMPDGRPFFGSPTKLFEYMAMAKGIIASNLDQLSSILEHGRSALLVEPGNVSELAAAIILLSRNSQLRKQLGQNARASAMSEHTWQQNAERVLARIPDRALQQAIGAAVRVEGI